MTLIASLEAFLAQVGSYLTYGFETIVGNVFGAIVESIVGLLASIGL